MAYSACLHCGRFAACFAGDVITGLHFIIRLRNKPPSFLLSVLAQTPHCHSLSVGDTLCASSARSK